MIYETLTVTTKKKAHNRYPKRLKERNQRVTLQKAITSQRQWKDGRKRTKELENRNKIKLENCNTFCIR